MALLAILASGILMSSPLTAQNAAPGNGTRTNAAGNGTRTNAAGSNGARSNATNGTRTNAAAGNAARGNAVRTPQRQNGNVTRPNRSNGSDLNGTDIESGNKPGEDLDKPHPERSSDPTGLEDADASEQVESAHGVRRFHEVLDELLAEFGYDVRQGQINGLKNLSIRKADVSEALPRTYENYLELLVEERIRENSQIRIIACLPCKARTTSVVDGRLRISSPQSNIAQLSLAAEQLGIDNFMDVVLVYHTTHMVLAFQIINSKTKELVWARAYNSETIKSRFQKLAVDYKQVEKSRTSDEYQPEYKYLIGMGVASVPNVTGDPDDRTMANIQIRAAERFNNRKSDIGLLLSIVSSSSSFISDYPTTGTDSTSESSTTTTSTEKTLTPFKSALMLHGFYAYNLLGSVEQYDKIRHGVNVGLGTILASGYVAGIVRGGWDIYFGRRFVVNFGLFDVLPSKVRSNNESISVAGGIGADIIMSINW